MKILAVDVDGTIWSPYGLAAEEINRLTNNKWNLKLSHMVHYDSFHHIAGNDIAIQGFMWACAMPELVPEREFYPHFPEAVEMLYDLGVKCHFITHNPRPRRMRLALRRWIEAAVDVPFGLSITQTGSKIPLMRREGAFGIVDDKPKMMEEALENGFFTATKRQLWNQDILLERPEIVGFDDWVQLPKLVEMELQSTDNRVGSVV